MSEKTVFHYGYGYNAPHCFTNFKIGASWSWSKLISMHLLFRWLRIKNLFKNRLQAWYMWRCMAYDLSWNVCERTSKCHSRYKDHKHSCDVSSIYIWLLRNEQMIMISMSLECIFVGCRNRCYKCPRLCHKLLVTMTFHTYSTYSTHPIRDVGYLYLRQWVIWRKR